MESNFLDGEGAGDPEGRVGREVPGESAECLGFLCMQQPLPQGAVTVFICSLKMLFIL